MSPTPRRVLVAVLSACALAVPAAAAAQTPTDQPWRDPARPPGERADALLAALSFDQKVAIALGDYAAVSNLGVPALNADDGPSGIRADGTTSFPSAQTLASTFDRELAGAYGDAIAAEARAKGFNWWLGPAMDIARTPLAGRQPENLGEDPFLAGETVAEEVAAAQRRHVIAAGVRDVPARGGRAAAPAQGLREGAARCGAQRARDVTFTLGPDELSVFDAGAGRSVVPDGRYTLWVGSSSRELEEHERFEIGERSHGR